MGLGGEIVNKLLKKKTVIIIAIELIFLILLGGLLFSMQTGLSVSNQKDAFYDKLEDMDEVLSQAEEAADTYRKHRNRSTAYNHSFLRSRTCGNNNSVPAAVI